MNNSFLNYLMSMSPSMPLGLEGAFRSPSTQVPMPRGPLVNPPINTFPQPLTNPPQQPLPTQHINPVDMDLIKRIMQPHINPPMEIEPPQGDLPIDEELMGLMQEPSRMAEGEDVEKIFSQPKGEGEISEKVKIRQERLRELMDAFEIDFRQTKFEGAGAGIAYMPKGQLITPEQKGKIFVSKPEFDKLTENQQRDVLNHEIAHYIYSELPSQDLDKLEELGIDEEDFSTLVSIWGNAKKGGTLRSSGRRVEQHKEVIKMLNEFFEIPIQPKSES